MAVDLWYASQEYISMAKDFLIQVEQVENTILLVENAILNIKNLNWSALPMIGGVLTNLQRVIGKAQGIGYNAETIIGEYETLYPRFHTPDGLGTHVVVPETLRGDQFNWNRQIQQAFSTAFQSQAQVAQNIDLGQAATQEAMAKSEGAVGALQAQQAGNQLLAVGNTQLIEIQQLLATQARAQASVEMMKAAEKNQALLYSQHWMEDFTVVTPTEGFHELPTTFR
jgi:P-type conjugative transfer protein TrbJ